jgi:hypothetical protein
MRGDRPAALLILPSDPRGLSTLDWYSIVLELLTVGLMNCNFDLARDVIQEPDRPAQLLGPSARMLSYKT